MKLTLCLVLGNESKMGFSARRKKSREVITQYVYKHVKMFYYSAIQAINLFFPKVV